MRPAIRPGRPWSSACAPEVVAGLINGLIIAYPGISPFVTTLGMLAIARSAAVVLSGNRMLYKFGPGGPAFKALGSGAVNYRSANAFDLSYPLLFLIVLTALLARRLQDDRAGAAMCWRSAATSTRLC